MIKTKYKRGDLFKNNYTEEVFEITATRLNCGFPFYYLKNKINEIARLKLDDFSLETHWKHLKTPAEKILYGI